MTYRECCKVLGICSDNKLYIGAPNNYVSDLENEICNKISTLNKLIICSKAYWKIAGEEMGLGKPWKPDWNDLNRKYFISLTCNGIGLYNDFRNPQVLAFPTKEMRDAF